MDIRTLRYFVEVVRQQSFTRAAEKLFVTQPTISKMLKNLEDELNCTLLIRDGRKLLLTDTGRVVFERGLAILAEFRQLEAELSDINHLNKGVLRLGIPPMVGMLMAGPISLFRQRYPGVELKISEFGGLTVQQAVMNGELDVAMTALPVEEASGLRHYRCSVIRCACWFPVQVSGQPATPSRLKHWRSILFLSITKTLP